MVSGMRAGIILAVVLAVLISSRSQAQITALLRPGDVFDLRLGGVPQEYAGDFAQQYTIDLDGTINVPLIGRTKAAGLRPAQLERTMEARFVASHIFASPAVSINVASANRHVSVSGGVRMPQRVQWSLDITLSSAIGECGGPTDFARSNDIRLLRDGNVAGVYRLKDLQKDPARDPKLLPGDQVVVPE